MLIEYDSRLSVFNAATKIQFQLFQLITSAIAVYNLEE